MGFKDIICSDIKNVFLNADEFAYTHTINGKDINAVIDDDIFEGEANVSFHGQAQEKAAGLYSGGIAAYVSADDMGKPKPGSFMIIDDKRYIVKSVSEQDGMYKINIEKTGGR